KVERLIPAGTGVGHVDDHLGDFTSVEASARVRIPTLGIERAPRGRDLDVALRVGRVCLEIEVGAPTVFGRICGFGIRAVLELHADPLGTTVHFDLEVETAITLGRHLVDGRVVDLGLAGVETERSD